MSVVLSEHLPLLASAPDGIQKLRGLILELAVRGKLVEQDPDEEPASELLMRIAKERARLEAEGVCKRSKSIPPVSDDEQPFALPDRWKWTRLDSVAPLPIADGDWIESKDQDVNGNVRLVQLADVGVGEFKDKSARFVNDETFSRLNCTEIVSGDILVARLPNPIGRACIFPGLDQKAITVVDVAILRPMRGTCSDYFVLAINAKTFREQVESYGKGATRFRVSTGHLKTVALPVPPLQEQHRIVAKVDELMALCDRLEAEQADAASAHARLVETLLGTLTQSTDTADLAANWQRLAEHFDTLFSTEACIDALKQTVLQLAVMGRLVPQDPNDEPASDLLKRMQKGRRFKRKCSVIDIDSLESPLPEIPSGWFWTVVDQVAADHENSIADGPFGANLKTEHYIAEAGYRVVRLQNIGYGDFRGEHHAYVTPERFLSLQKHHVFAGDLVVAGLVDDRVRCCELPKTIGHALVKADCYRFAVHPEVCSAFALHYLNSPLSSDFAAAHHHGMTLTRIGLGNFRLIPFPLPPLAEQRRIVAKVDELMALCDTLKADLANSRTRQARLSSTLIESALQAA